MFYPLPTKRHSLAHIMAMATRMAMGADTKLAIGPDVDNGWYYDMDFGDKTLEEKQLKEIEKKMRQIIREGQELKQFTLSMADAKHFLHVLGDTYKLEMAEDLEKKGETTLSFFANIGKFQNPLYADFGFLNNPESREVVTQNGITVADHKTGETNFDFRTATFIDMCQ